MEWPIPLLTPLDAFYAKCWALYNSIWIWMLTYKYADGFTNSWFQYHVKKIINKSGLVHYRWTSNSTKGFIWAIPTCDVFRARLDIISSCDLKSYLFEVEFCWTCNLDFLHYIFLMNIKAPQFLKTTKTSLTLIQSYQMSKP